jgi:hypothetical protein
MTQAQQYELVTASILKLQRVQSALLANGHVDFDTPNVDNWQGNKPFVFSDGSRLVQEI